MDMKGNGKLKTAYEVLMNKIEKKKFYTYRRRMKHLLLSDDRRGLGGTDVYVCVCLRTGSKLLYEKVKCLDLMNTSFNKR